jgi:hypothetical protein
MEFQRTKRKKHTSAAPPRLVELTLVARFPDPWKGNMPGAVQAIEEKRWHPTLTDFAAIARTPNKAARPRTTIKYAGDISELVQRLCYFDEESQWPRPNQNLVRVNLISHGGNGVFALSGEVHTDGRVMLGRGDPNPLLDRRIDERTIEWFNTDPVGLVHRDAIREKLHPTAEFWLVLCNGACLGKSYILAQELANTLGVTVKGYRDEVWCHPDRPAPGNCIRCLPGARACIDGRNLTSIGENGQQGRGYCCWTKVPDAFAGQHMSAAESFPPKQVRD